MQICKAQQITLVQNIISFGMNLANRQCTGKDDKKRNLNLKTEFNDLHADGS